MQPEVNSKERFAVLAEAAPCRRSSEAEQLNHNQQVRVSKSLVGTKLERCPRGRRSISGKYVIAKSGSWVRIPFSPPNASMVELVYTADLKPAAERIKGSTPFRGTQTCPYGGTGRRAALKTQFRKECRFDSDYGYTWRNRSRSRLAELITA